MERRIGGGGAGGHRPGVPGRGGRPGGQPKKPTDRGPGSLEARAEELHRTTGIPLLQAKQVALGKADLNDVLKQMVFRDEVTSLIARHGLDRALATQIALGQADLERALRKQRVEAHLADAIHRDILVTALTSGNELVMGLHGRQLVRARIVGDSAYEVTYADLDTQARATVHKTRIKFAADGATWGKTRKAMTWDSARKAVDVEPVLRPQDRYGCSNHRLGDAWDRKSEVTVTLLEGEVFVGRLAWVSQWEVGLHTKGGDVSIFRHAIVEFVG